MRSSLELDHIQFFPLSFSRQPIYDCAFWDYRLRSLITHMDREAKIDCTV